MKICKKCKNVISPEQKYAQLCKNCRDSISRENGKTDSRYNSSIPVTDDGYQVILGSILGDGHLAAPLTIDRNWGLDIKHCKEQNNYLLWKATLLGDLVGKIDYPNNQVRVRTVKHAKLTEIANGLDKNYTSDYAKLLYATINELGIGVFYLDDGNITPAQYRKNGKYMQYDKTNIRIASNAFNINEVEFLSGLISEKIKIQAKPSKTQTANAKGNAVYNIRIYGDDAIEFINKIRPRLVNAGMDYKFVTIKDEKRIKNVK